MNMEIVRPVLSSRFANISPCYISRLPGKSLGETRCLGESRGFPQSGYKITQTQELYFFLAETKFIWKSPQLCRKIEVPKVFISEENKTPYFSPALLNGSQKAVK